MTCSTRSHPNVVPPMTNPGAALRASQDPSFEMGRNKEHDDVPIPACEPVLIDESEPWYGKVAVAINVEAPFKHESRHIENDLTNEEDEIAREVKSAVKEMVTNGL